jgi:carbamoyltransferase
VASVKTAILGISAFFHDSAAALVVDGDIVAAAQEERFSRRKYDAAFPTRAIEYCLAEGGLRPDDLQCIAFYEKPLVKFERLLETYLAYAPSGIVSFSRAMPAWLKRKLFMRRTIKRAFRHEPRAPVVFLDHHESHAASAFFPSPFERAAILTMDGVGEWSTATLGIGDGARIEIDRQLRFPHSLGLLYSAFTYYCGFAVNGGEYKLMGLAPYGRPIYVEDIYRHVVDLKEDGSLWLDMNYFNYCQGLTMTGPRFHALFGGPPRQPDSALEPRHMDIAASIQRVTEDCVLRVGRHLHERTGMSNLVMAGGVALNCVANARLLREGPFERIWIQPAAGDAGGALGAALFASHQLVGVPRRIVTPDAQKASCLGPAYSSADVDAVIRDHRVRIRRFDCECALLDSVVDRLAAGDSAGWFQGRSEFGPRALGARSILGDARSTRMQANINRQIKFRESFRPFAPSVLREHAHEWFAMPSGHDSPYMLLVAPVAASRRRQLSEQDADTLAHDSDLLRRVNIPRSDVPAVTHVDYSARLQTVDERHGRYRRLLERFHEKTGCPMLVNTSFNLSWEPIVQTPAEAYHTFMQSALDVLVLGDVVVSKDEQPLGLQLWARDVSDISPSSPWADPVTGDPLVVMPNAARNPQTGTCYAVEGGIPRLFASSHEDESSGRDVTDVVKQFYEATPFPNYEDVDTPRALIEKARAGMFARLLNDQIPYDARVLEIGCGTGQLTNFLSVAHRTVLGVDVCLNSLELAETFRSAHGLERAAFAQMNLFRPALKSGFFDVVISNGVLHHTGDCRKAFQRVGELVAPGGFLIVGLYNAYSRQVHYARRAVYRWTGIANRWLDPQFGKLVASGKRDAWLRDQYCHPHETTHTLDELLQWMDQDGFTFVNSIPKPSPGASLTHDERLFEPRRRGSSFSRIASQLAALSNGYYEGGFFVVICQRDGRS